MASIPEFTNNFSTTLTQNASASSTQLYLDVVEGLPDISDGNYFKLTVTRASDGVVEIVKVNEVNSISRYVSVDRGEEDTTPVAFVIGDEVELRLTAEPLNYLLYEIDRLTTSETSLLEASSEAIDSAAAAAVSEANAATSEANAATIASNSSTSATAAAISEANAADSATGAAASATAAATSEVNAAASATAAATSETNAATSEANAATSETNAATSASDAATSEANAATSETNAATSASDAATSASNASASATAAATSEANAATSASDAATSETNAAASATAAATSEANTEDLLEEFETRYLGSKSSAPSVDNEGNALEEGALYYDSTENKVYFYNGSSWEQISTYTNATETVAGVVEKATTTEAEDGTADKFPDAAGVAAAISALAASGDYDNSTSGLSATTVQGAIDELDSDLLDVFAQQSLATAGYQKLPGGLIIQWGQATSSNSGAAAVSFPITFPNEMLALSYTPIGGVDNVGYIPGGVAATSASGFDLNMYSNSNGSRTTVTCSYIAIGY